jgi:hypothetical protein
MMTTRIPPLTLAASVVAMSLLSACDNNRITEPTQDDPDQTFTINYMDGAPTQLSWGSAVTIRAFFPEQRSWQ